VGSQFGGRAANAAGGSPAPAAKALRGPKRADIPGAHPLFSDTT